MTRLLPQGDVIAVTHYRALTEKEPSGEAIMAAIEWLETSEENRAAYRHLAAFAHACDEVVATLPMAEIQTGLQMGRSSSTWRSRMLPWSNQAIAACFLGLVTIGALTVAFIDRLPQQAGQVKYANYSTKIGEDRMVTLSDRSRIMLGGASAVRVAYGNGFRRLSLVRGQATFKVVHDVERPFIVETMRGSVRAVGTEFDVHRTPRGTTITVLEGAVDVSAKGKAGATIAPLKQGMQVNLSQAGTMSPIVWADLRTATAWRTGTLRFVSVPLEVVVADLNRYSKAPIKVEGADLRGEKITGIVRTDRIMEWLQALATSATIDLDITEEGTVILRTAQTVHLSSKIRGAQYPSL